MLGTVVRSYNKHINLRCQRHLTVKVQHASYYLSCNRFSKSERRKDFGRLLYMSSVVDLWCFKLILESVGATNRYPYDYDSFQAHLLYGLQVLVQRQFVT